ncbi:DUF2336 domain-containing protein [Rhizobium rosettiformans]|uniref:DUF2336 domain-containing protein n=1 Tax=Rhizobium rosettiformans TaxID=1368430 RepID=UPI00286609E9|nr:DUF2336 domain-containing protein [Rhizobium rosettiformans]MDR7026795.1 uncharacterized protein (DUF2336 family) [Rhizobium rosettiformans]MDR7064916.1 uncharacterized protein (DUF2336 family) [Rhizobium rosettiformans]
MSEQFRELEKPAGARNKDVVLMATVTSFQALSFPGKSELRQFAELFQPLFAGSSVEARREAVAALSRSPNLPLSVAAFIASQPISIAAPFLASSPALSDDMLIMIARTQGADHARAIVKRERLSPTVIDALVSLRHALPPRPEKAKAEEIKVEPPQKTAPSSFDKVMADLEMSDLSGAVAPQKTVQEPVAREEALRQTIKRMAYQQRPPREDRLGRRQATPVQTALLVRFARAHDGGFFATTLADMLSSSRWLAERILLDISGRQLATTLAGVAMEDRDAIFILEHIYPHLARRENGASRAETLLFGMDPDQAEARIDSWIRADRYTFSGEELPVVARETEQREVPVTGATSLKAANQGSAKRQPVGDEHGRQVLRARKR